MCVKLYLFMFLESPTVKNKQKKQFYKQCLVGFEIRVKSVAAHPLGRNLAGCSTQCSCLVSFSSPPPSHTSAVQDRHTDTPAHTHPICPTWVPIFIGQHLHQPKEKTKWRFPTPTTLCQNAEGKVVGRNLLHWSNWVFISLLFKLKGKGIISSQIKFSK